MSVSLAGGGSIGSATLQLVAPGSLRARNTLEQRDAVAAKHAAVEIENGKALFTLPSLSAGVITIKP